MERRGIPGAYVLSEEFRQADIAQSKALGFVANKVFVEHPIQDRSDAEMFDIAERAFNEVVKMIVETKVESNDVK